MAYFFTSASNLAPDRGRRRTLDMIPPWAVIVVLQLSTNRTEPEGKRSPEVLRTFERIQAEENYAN